MDRLSIVIPAYNAERYLGKCVESILKQTYENVEIIIVDDAFGRYKKYTGETY